MLLPRVKNDNIAELALNELQIKMKDQISQKVEKKIYQFEQINCPVCNHNDTELVGKKDRYGLFFSTNLCVECGLVYTSPRMNEEAYSQFYNDEYRKLYTGKTTATTTFFEDQKKKGQKIYHFLKSNHLISSDPISVFEIGCGAGGILDYLRDKGHSVQGIDLGREYLEYGKKEYGLDLEISTLSQFKPQKKYDLVIYCHVLEHIPDLKKELEGIKNIVDENTLVYIEVPGLKEVHKNYESNFLKYFQNAHTFHFTLESLTNVFQSNGFELILGNQFVRSVFRYTGKQSHYQSDYKEIKKYLLTTESNRKYHNFTSIGIKNACSKFIHSVLDLTKTRRIARSIRLFFKK